MGQRVIPVAVTAEYIGGDGVTLGAAGSHSNVVIEYDFRSAGPMWEGTTKYVLWTNPQGNSTNRVDLGVDKLVDGYENVYHASPTADAMCVAGWCEMVVVGVTVEATTDEDSGETTSKETLKVKTEPSRFRVLPGSSRSSDNEGVAATVADQLQTEIEAGYNNLDSKKVNKPVTPYDPNGEEGQYLVSLGDGRTKWKYLDIVTYAQVEEVLNNHKDWVTTVQDGAITGRKIAEKTKVWRNIADYVDGDDGLTSETIGAAFAMAMDEAQYLYIPAGEYTCNLEVHGKDITIMMDSGTVLRTDNIRPALRCEDCSVTIIGGEVGAGSDYTDRTYVYPLEPGEGKAQAHGIIELTRCHDCSISGLRSRNSNYPSVIQLTDCLRVDVERCDFRNGINSFIHIISSHVESGEAYPQSGSIRVANCSFVNVLHREGIAWCYAVYTGAVSLTDNFMPPDGLIYENNYVYNTEDSALDTHGATNVIMRNNVIRQVVCALTAYNDNKRVVRPAGWNMYNVLFENNYVESDKSPSQLAIRQHVAHALLITGAANTTGVDIEDDDDMMIGSVGNYHEISGVTIRNNYFKSSNNQPTLISTYACCANLTIEGNIFDMCNSNARPLFIRRSLNFRLANNLFRNYINSVRVYNSVGEIGENEGLKITISPNSFSYVKNMCNNYKGIGLPQLLNMGDRYLLHNGMRIAKNYGLEYRKGSVSDEPQVANDPTSVLTGGRPAVVSDGIIYMKKHVFVPGMNIRLVCQDEGANYEASYFGYISTLLDFNSFKSTITSIPNGNYLVYAIEAVTTSATSLAVGTTRTDINTTVRETPTRVPPEGEDDLNWNVMATLERGTTILCDASNQVKSDDNDDIFVRVFLNASDGLSTGWMLVTSVTIGI